MATATVHELQQIAIELFKADYQARSDAAKVKGVAIENVKAALKDKESAFKAYDASEAGPTAKKLGQALVAVREAMANGEFTKWCSATFKGGVNRANYCIRVAEGKTGKQIREEKKATVAKKFPHKPVIEKVTKELNQLVHLLAAGKKENADELMAKIIDEVKALYKSTQEHCKQIVEERKALQAQIAEADKKAEATRKLLVKKEREIRSNFSAPRAKGASTSA